MKTRLQAGAIWFRELWQEVREDPIGSLKLVGILLLALTVVVMVILFALYYFTVCVPLIFQNNVLEVPAACLVR